MGCGTEKTGKDFLLKAGNLPAFKAKKIIQNIIYTAVAAGVAGNDTTITIVDTSSGGLAVTVVSTDIEVDLGGDTPTAIEIIAAIEAFSAAAALVTAKCFASRTVLQVIQAETSLEDGVDASAAFATIGGLRSKGLTINNEAIDVTNHDSDQYKQLLDEAGIASFALSGAGIFTTAANLDYIRRASVEGKLLEMKIIDDDASKQFHGVYKITSFERAGEYNGEQSYSLTIESSGEVVFGTAV